LSIKGELWIEIEQILQYRQQGLAGRGKWILEVIEDEGSSTPVLQPAMIFQVDEVARQFRLGEIEGILQVDDADLFELEDEIKDSKAGDFRQAFEDVLYLPHPWLLIFAYANMRKIGEKTKCFLPHTYFFINTLFISWHPFTRTILPTRLSISDSTRR